MPLVIGVPKETDRGEKRVAVVPEVVKKFKALGADLCIERGAGAESFIFDEDFGAGIIAASSGDVFAGSEVILKVQPPTLDEVRLMRTGTILIGFLHPYQDRERAKLLCERNITSFAVELINRQS